VVVGTFAVPVIVAILALLLFSDPGMLRAEDPVNYMEMLSGAKLERNSRVSSGLGSDSSIKIAWDLCPDGTFRSSHSATSSVEGSGSQSLSINQTSNTGRWSVEMQGQDALLVLIPRGGQRTVYQLVFDGQTLYLEGEKVGRTRSRVCP
jgi:hypothetical protein